MATRVISALVLAPIVLVAIHLGPPASDGLLLATVGVLAWEWARLCSRRRRFGFTDAALVVASLAVLVAGSLYGLTAAMVIVGLGALAVALAGTRNGAAEEPVARLPLWLAFGLLYVALPLLALQWLRGPAGQEEPTGALRLFWLVGLVWATDVGAFFAGRTLKGPKLWPRISPNKTWAGMVGGLIAAALVGAGFARQAEPASLWQVVLLSAVLSFVAQAGDFFESGVKRRFGAKDSSGLIPGHGGLLDRVDGLLAAAVALAFLAWLGKAPF